MNEQVASKKVNEQVGVAVQVAADAHTRLKAIAKERRVTLDLLVKQLLLWASRKEGPELTKLGVGLPIWPEDLE